MVVGQETSPPPTCRPEEGAVVAASVVVVAAAAAAVAVQAAEKDMVVETASLPAGGVLSGVHQGGTHRLQLLQEVQCLVHTSTEVGLVCNGVLWSGHQLVYGHRCDRPHHQCKVQMARGG
jgi:hypothetical protein